MIPFRQVREAMDSGEDKGFCIACGAEHYGVEPDACNYLCEECGEEEVFGAEEIFLQELYEKED